MQVIESTNDSLQQWLECLTKTNRRFAIVKFCLISQIVHVRQTTIVPRAIGCITGNALFPFVCF